VFIEAKDDGGGGDNWRSWRSSQITTTNKPSPSFFTGRMPFLSPNQQCQSTIKMADNFNFMDFVIKYKNW